METSGTQPGIYISNKILNSGTFELNRTLRSNSACCKCEKENLCSCKPEASVLQDLDLQKLSQNLAKILKEYVVEFSRKPCKVP